MKIPKPLLIVIVVIVILGVVSCGAGVLRGVNQEPKPNASTAAGGFGGVINGPLDPRDIVVAGGNCTVSGAQITIPSVCDLRLEPVALLPRVLKLEIDASSTDDSVKVTVEQVIDGETRSGDDTVSPNGTATPDIKVSVAGSSPISVTLECGSCVLDIIR